MTIFIAQIVHSHL